MILLLPGLCSAQQQADSVTTDSSVVKQDTVVPIKHDSTYHQVSVGFDIFHPIMNAFTTDRSGYEFCVDYYMRRDLYLKAEGGFGASNVTYTDLKYTTSNTFGRIGIDRAIVPREHLKDWDMMFIGLRLAFAPIHRNPASFTVLDSVWGNSTSTLASRDFVGYWFELVGGMRVEIAHGLFAGWALRGKFLLDGGDFRQLAPLYVAGYGSGDKNVVFDFNFYFTYAVRWKPRHYPIIPKRT
jgi:hypothetical protein